MSDDRASLPPSREDDPPFEPSPSVLRRPGLVLLAVGYRLVAGLLVAAPVAAFFGTFVSGYPRGDAELFDPGGLMLLEAVRFGARAIPVTMIGASLPALVAVFAGLLPHAALIAGLARRGPLSRAFLARATLARIGTLALLWGTGIAAQILLAVIVVLLGGKVVDTLHLRAHAEDLAYLVLAAVTGLVVIAAGVVRDLAAVAAVAHEDGYYIAVSRALRTAFRLPGSIVWAYGARAALAIAILGAAFQLAPPGAASLGVPFAIHEGAIVLTVLLHTSWLASAIQLVTAAAPPRTASTSSTSSTSSTASTVSTLDPDVIREEPPVTVVPDEPDESPKEPVEAPEPREAPESMDAAEAAAAPEPTEPAEAAAASEATKTPASDLAPDPSLDR